MGEGKEVDGGGLEEGGGGGGGKYPKYTED